MTFKPVPPTYHDDKGNLISFVKVDGVPGFTHRVIINGKQVDWLSDNSKPSLKVALFFWEKHSNEHEPPLTP